MNLFPWYVVYIRIGPIRENSMAILFITSMSVKTVL